MKTVLNDHDFFKLVSWLRYEPYNPNHLTHPIFAFKFIAQTLNKSSYHIK